MAKNDENKKNVNEQENVNENQENVNKDQENANEQETKPKKENWFKKAIKTAGKVVKKAWDFEVTLSPRKVVLATAGVATAIFVGKRIYEAGQADAQSMLDYSDEYEALPGEVDESTDVYTDEVYDNDEIVDVTDYDEVVEE